MSDLDLTAKLLQKRLGAHVSTEPAGPLATSQSHLYSSVGSSSGLHPLSASYGGPSTQQHFQPSATVSLSSSLGAGMPSQAAQPTQSSASAFVAQVRARAKLGLGMDGRPMQLPSVQQQQQHQTTQRQSPFPSGGDDLHYLLGLPR